MSTLSWRGNQGCLCEGGKSGNCPRCHGEGNGWTVEQWVDGSLRSRTFDTRAEAEEFQAKALIENVWE